MFVLDKAFILAAGLGTRMRPLTDCIPKPLACVAERTLLDRALDHLYETGVRHVIVNVHHKASMIGDHLALRTDLNITLSYEKILLDTGGGIAHVVTFFENKDFFVVAGDALWQGQALADLQQNWDPERMDILILLQPISSMHLTQGIGDYDLLPNGKAVRRADKSGAYMFTSLRINASHIFANAPQGPFSYLTLLDKAEAEGRLYGLVHKGTWHHISTMADITAVEKEF